MGSMQVRPGPNELVREEATGEGTIAGATNPEPGHLRELAGTCHYKALRTEGRARAPWQQPCRLREETCLKTHRKAI